MAPTEWKFLTEAFQLLLQEFRQPNIDLFITCLGHQLMTYISPLPDPQTWAVDEFSITWEGQKTYFLPPLLLPKVIQGIKKTMYLDLSFGRTLVTGERVIRQARKNLDENDSLPLSQWSNLLIHPQQKIASPNVCTHGSSLKGV